MTIKSEKITKTDILEIIEKRKNKESVKYYSFEEAYEIGKNYIPKI